MSYCIASSTTSRLKGKHNQREPTGLRRPKAARAFTEAHLANVAQGDEKLGRMSENLHASAPKVEARARRSFFEGRLTSGAKSKI
jgi:hypothetical protein